MEELEAESQENLRARIKELEEDLQQALEARDMAKLETEAVVGEFQRKLDNAESLYEGEKRELGVRNAGT